MKILHTSDWHLGRSLYGRKRYDEFKAFFNWLISLIKEEKVELLLVAGDIFDNTTPSNRSQNLYYNFLKRALGAGCKNIVITGGNHDSPTFLEAPAQILKSMNVHVVGHIDNDLEKEIITIKDKNDNDKIIVCAVPYLREIDIRDTVAGESIEEKRLKLSANIAKHYKEIIELAVQKRDTSSSSPAIVCMGHLFAAGGTTSSSDGVRELYVGTLSHVPSTVFPDAIDYLALGHLHSSQMIGGLTSRRYCGSPLPMSFGEAESQKKVILVTFDSTMPEIREQEVPCFQKLISIRGDSDTLLSKLHNLKVHQEAGWLELIYDGNDIPGNFQELLSEQVRDSNLEILRILNEKIIQSIFEPVTESETLDNLSVREVFNRCLTANEISEEQETELTLRFEQVVRELHEEDHNAD